MPTREQSLVCLCWAKDPGFAGEQMLPSLGLTTSQAALIRQHYTDALAGGARASKAFMAMTPTEREILEEWDPMGLELLQNAVETIRQDLDVVAPWQLTVKTPSELNGLLIWMLPFASHQASRDKVDSAYSDICKVGGSPNKVAQLVDLAQQWGLLREENGQCTLTQEGVTYASGGGTQGAERFELTNTRREVLLTFWRNAQGKIPVLSQLEASLLDYARSPFGDLTGTPQRWLRELEVVSDNHLSPVGVSLLHRIYTTLSGGQDLRGLVSQVEGDLRQELARLSDRIATLSRQPTPSSSSTVMAAIVGAQPPAWNPEIPAIFTEFHEVADERKLLENCASRLSVAGYSMDYEELTNLYICGRAGRLTILAGAPGVGKSSLVRKLSESLGHRSSLKEIAVRRGWTDDQQFLGAVNRLHQRYDPAPTGVVHQLMIADLDQECGLYWFLLDEFNLSTPEYYFAELISILESDKPVSLYDAHDPNIASNSQYPPDIPVGNNVHFYGTINLDETAYVPSPRLIDRANFIWVERQVGLEVLSGGALPSHAVGPISAKEYLARQRPPALGNSAQKRLKLILDTLGQDKKDLGTPHTVSPRAILGVASYMANSQHLLAEDEALDYAVSQRILPGLRGMGDGFLRRMDALHDVLKAGGLRRCQRLVRRMIDSGRDRREFDMITSLF